MKQFLKLLVFFIFSAVLANAAVPATPDLVDASDSNINNDDITNNTTLTFTGANARLSLITLFIDGTKQTVTSTANPYSLTKYIGNGNHSIRVSEDNNNSNLSATLSIVVDTVSPTLSIDLKASSDSGSSSTDNITNDDTPSFSGTSNEQVDFTIDGSDYNGTTSWNHTYAALAPDGIKNISVSATDIAGNTKSISLNVTIDTTAILTINSVTTTVQDFEHGINVSFSRNSYDKDISFKINSKTFIVPSGYNSLFIKDADTGLTDGTNYGVTLNTMTDRAGNAVTLTAGFNFDYDRTSDTKNYARKFTIGSNFSEYLNADTDYFLFDMQKKGAVTLSSNNSNATVAIQKLNAVDIVATTQTITSKVLDKGSYLMKVSGTLDGTYSINTSVSYLASLEIDTLGVPRDTIANSNILMAGSQLYADGGMIYSSDYAYQISDTVVSNHNTGMNNKFAIKDGNFLYTSGTQLVFENILSSTTNYVDASNRDLSSLSLVGDSAYVLTDNSTVEVYNVSNPSSVSLVKTITLPDVNGGYQEILVSSDETALYAKVSDNGNYIFYAIDISTSSVSTYFDKLYITDFAQDNGLLFLATPNGVYIFDISNDAKNPKYLWKTNSYASFVASYNNKLYIKGNSTNIISYDIGHDLDDTVVDEKLLSKIELGSAVSINRMSGKADVDIFRVDLENSGDLIFTSSGDTAGVNISVDDNSNFASPKLATTTLSASHDLGAVTAGTYYIKLESPNESSLKSFTFKASLSTTDTVKDKLLNTSLAENNPISLVSTTSGKLIDASDIDLHKIIIPADGNFSATVNTGSVSLVSLDVDTASSYSTESSVVATTPAVVKAGTYYLKVTHTGATAYTITPNYTSYASKDESNQNIFVDTFTHFASTATRSLSLTGGFRHTPYANNLRVNRNTVYTDAKDKIYFSQVSDGKFIYAIYKHKSDYYQQLLTYGIDKFEYINSSNVVFKDTKLLTTIGDDAKLKYQNSKLYLKETGGWYEYSSNLVKGSLFLASSYIDFEVDTSGKIYAITSSKVDVLNSAKSLQRTKNIANATSVEYDANFVYVGTSDDGIKALSISNLSIFKEMKNTLNVVSLESKGDTLYVLEEQSNVAGELNRRVVSMDIGKDYGDDFANASLVPFGVDITARINEVGEKDFFKVDLPKAGSISTTVTGNPTCNTLYDANLSNLGGCTQASVNAGTYYFEISNASQDIYTFNVTTTPITGEVADTLNFFDITTFNFNTTSTTTSISSTMDVANDIDYYKVTIDTTGTLDLNTTKAILVYENGETVDSNGSVYDIKISGDYFIKVTDTSTGILDINASFISIVDDRFIDKAHGIGNADISEIALSGTKSKIISSGNIVYLIDDIGGLSVIDIGDIQNPVVSSKVDIIGTAKNLSLNGTTLSIATGVDGFTLVDVSNANSSSIHSQNNVGESVNSVVTIGNFAYAVTTNKVNKYNVSDPSNYVLTNSISLSGASDIIVNGSKLLVTYTSGVKELNQDLSISKSLDLTLTSPTKIIKDSNYIFVADSSGISIINASDLSDTNKGVSLSGVNDLYINNKALYISQGSSYTIMEYQDMTAIDPIFVDIAVDSITMANGTLILAKPSLLSIVEAIPDYTDTLQSQLHFEKDILQDNIITGQFSKNGDIDTFELINVTYTGTLSMSMTADEDVKITLYDGEYNQIVTGVNSISKIVNAGAKYIQVQAVTSTDKVGYRLDTSFVNDGVKDVLTDNYDNTEITKDDSISSTLYSGGKDKDYYKLVMDARGKIDFDSNNNQNIKISILYRSGTILASNYDANTGKITPDFEVTLSSGDYYLLVENATTTTTEQSYDITTSFSSDGEINMDSGASTTTLDSISSFAYVDKFSYILKDGTLHRMSNILESKNNYDLQLSDTANLKLNMFAYPFDSDEDFIYISVIDLDDSTQNKVYQLAYENYSSSIQQKQETTIDGIIDEDVMLIDSSEYIYYYDDDSLYIASINNTQTSRQLAYQDLSIVKVSGNYMYAVTDKFVQIVDISDKDNLSTTDIVETINTENIKSIYIDDNVLFVGANNKVEVWDISDKTSVTLLSEISISFTENDLYYTGTPTSMYMQGGTLYTTVEGVGLIFFELDTFNELSITNKILNLGENLTDIYTYKGGAINYVIDDELKVYFNSKQVHDADSAGTYEVVDANSIQEGSEVFEGCFIATAAYGSYFDANVKVLRGFRNDYLMHNELGRVFVDFYYAHSPSIAKEIQGSELSKTFVRAILMPIVYLIKYPLVFIMLVMMLLFIAYMKKRTKSITKLGSI